MGGAAACRGGVGAAPAGNTPLRGRKAPRCIVIAGPNGAGKTTLAREFLPKSAKGTPALRTGFGQAFKDLAETECGPEALRSGTLPESAIRACSALANLPPSPAELGSIQEAKLDAGFSAMKRDSLYVAHIQSAYGHPMPLAISARLKQETRKAHSRRRAYAMQVMEGLKQALAEAKGP